MNLFKIFLFLILFSTTILASVFNFTSIPKYNINNIELNTFNFFSIRDSITPNSISKAIMDISNLHNSNPYIIEFYLVLDTPGGSVISGNQLIDYINYKVPDEIKKFGMNVWQLGNGMHQ